MAADLDGYGLPTPTQWQYEFECQLRETTGGVSALELDSRLQAVHRMLNSMDYWWVLLAF